jgi:hypothetical protein
MKYKNLDLIKSYLDRICCCLLENTVRCGRGEMDWKQSYKGQSRDCCIELELVKESFSLTMFGSV